MPLVIGHGIEDRLMERHLRLVTLFFQCHGKNRFGAYKIAIRISDGAGPHQPLGWYYFLARALPHHFAAVRSSHPEVIGTSCSRIHFARGGAEPSWTPPTDQVTRFGPSLEHECSGSVEDPRN